MHSCPAIRFQRLESAVLLVLGRLLTSDFSDSDAGLGGGFKVHVVAADARGERQLQLLRLGDALGREVAGEEGRGDDLHSTCASATAD